MSSMTLLNQTGDITISWDDHQDEKMRELIKRKLDKGYAFFIVKPRFLGIMKSKKTLKSIKELSDSAREISLRDEDAKELICDRESILIGSTPKDEEIEMEKSTKDVDTIASSNTIAIRPIAAG